MIIYPHLKNVYKIKIKNYIMEIIYYKLHFENLLSEINKLDQKNKKYILMIDKNNIKSNLNILKTNYPNIEKAIMKLYDFVIYPIIINQTIVDVEIMTIDKDQNKDLFKLKDYLATHT